MWKCRMNSSRVLFPTALLLVWVFAFLLAGCGQGTVARTPEQTAQQFIDAFSSLDWNPMGSLIDPQFVDVKIKMYRLWSCKNAPSEASKCLVSC